MAKRARAYPQHGNKTGSTAVRDATAYDVSNRGTRDDEQNSGPHDEEQQRGRGHEHCKTTRMKLVAGTTATTATTASTREPPGRSGGAGSGCGEHGKLYRSLLAGALGAAN